jgi:hypothetical protein
MQQVGFFRVVVTMVPASRSGGIPLTWMVVHTTDGPALRSQSHAVRY